MKSIRDITVCVALSGALIFGVGSAANAETLGWSEDATVSDSQTVRPMAGTVRHTGKAEQKSINGTTHKRAHGWTTWTGKYHYTRARLEKGKTINGDSGHRWGTNGTEAVSPYRPFKVIGGNLESPGSARTYYGS